MTSTPAPLEQYRPRVSTALRAAMPASEHPLYNLLRYHMGWVDEAGTPVHVSTGKVMRPLLCLFTCEAVGGNVEHAVPAAAALELIHNFSLIHDDIQDGDTQRRGRATVWSVWGKPQALVAGNALRVVADRALQELPSHGVAQDRAVEATRYLTERYLEMIEGQYLDLSYEGKPKITEQDYLDMVGRKTGALIEAAMYLGAYLGTGDQERVEALRRCGRLVGLAFQVRDDVLGIWGDADVLGKATGADLRKQKRSFPVVYGLQHAKGQAGARLREIASGPPPDDDQVQEELRILEETGAREYAQAFAEERGDQAMVWARRAHLRTESQEELERLVHFVLTRQH